MGMYKRFIVFVIVSLLAGGLAYLFLPLPPGMEGERASALHNGLGMAAAICVAQIIAAWFFISSLKLFKTQMKLAYYIVSAGLLMLMLSQLQLPLLLYFTQFFGGVTGTLVVLTPMVLAPFAIYAGIQRFTRLVGITSRWRSIPLAIGVALLAGLIPFVVMKKINPEMDYSITVVQIQVGLYSLLMAGSALMVIASVLVWQIRHKLTPAYGPAMKWLGVALAAFAFFPPHEFVSRVVLAVSDTTYAYAASNLSIWPLLLTAILFIGAGIHFKAINQQYGTLNDQANPVDVIVHIAGLVSNPDDIDDMLDDLRQITAVRSTKELTDADRRTLGKLYLDLEQYLVTKEPLRQFSRDDLRALLPGSFKAQLTPSNT